MLHIRLHVVRGDLVGGEDIVEKCAILAARFDARKQGIERFRDVAAQTQFQGNAPSDMSRIAVDLNDCRVFREKIGVEEIRSEHDQNVTVFQSML